MHEAATTVFFQRWESQFAGRFLHRNLDDELVPNLAELVDHAPRLSQGERIYVGAWWELTRGHSAPWLDKPAFAQLASIDADHRQSIVDLVVAVAADWSQHEIGRFLS